MAKFIPDGAVELYHDNSLKVQTNSNGLEVHGKLVTGNNDIPSGQISNYSLDVQGDGTNAYIDLGNPFPTFSAGQFPVARLKTVDANKTLEIHSMWGGDNVLYKHIELAADKTKFFRGTSTNVEIASFGTFGLTFNGDTADANALDDYEEGTWNPVPSDGNNSFNYGQEYGSYTKIGNVIHVSYAFNASLPSTSGYALFINLPFGVKDFSNNTNEGIGYSKGTGVEIQLEAQQGQSRMKLRSPSSGAALTPNSVGMTNNVTKTFRGAITYLTT